MIETIKKIWDFSGDEQKNINKSIGVVFMYALFSMAEMWAIYLILSSLLKADHGYENAWYALGLIVVSILGKASMKYFSQLQQTHAGFLWRRTKDGALRTN